MTQRIWIAAIAVTAGHLVALAVAFTLSAQTVIAPQVLHIELLAGAPRSPQPAPPALRQPLSRPQSAPPAQAQPRAEHAMNSPTQPPAEPIAKPLLPQPAVPAPSPTTPLSSSPTADATAESLAAAKSLGSISREALAQQPNSPGDRAPRVDASFGGNPLPVYPTLSRRLGEQGTVSLRVLINAQGQATEIRIETSSGSARLDQAAVAAIRTWRFVPALRAGKPVSEWYEWKWQFRLDG